MQARIRRYRCTRPMTFEKCDDDGRIIDGEYMTVPEGSVWRESPYMMSGDAKNNVHLDREDGGNNERSWCEPLKEHMGEHFTEIEPVMTDT